MFYTLRELFTNLVKYRSQVFHLAAIDMRKASHNTALGWLWIFIKPAMYILCFWFALYLGLRAARVSGLSGGEYMIWLAAGIIPWFFLQRMLAGGSDVFRKYPYLVNKLKFPVVLVPVFFELSGMMVHLMLLACLCVGYLAGGGTLDIYAIQVPILIVLMYCFSVGWSLMLSPLSAVSKDIKNLIGALSTPIFWLSGVLFDITSVDIAAVKIVSLFNPVTFLVTSYRQVFSIPGATGTVKTWIWSDPMFFGCGVGVIILTIIVGCIVFARLHKEIPDVL